MCVCVVRGAWCDVRVRVRGVCGEWCMWCMSVCVVYVRVRGVWCDVRVRGVMCVCVVCGGVRGVWVCVV